MINCQKIENIYTEILISQIIIYQSINLSIYQSINLSIYQSINLSIYITLKKMTDISPASILNSEIVNAHNAHIKNGINELIDTNLQPNGNFVYHLYSTGIITYQKGSYAYLQRSEFEEKSYLIYKYRVGKLIDGVLKYVPGYTSYMKENYNKVIQYFDPIFTFPLETESYGGATYVILTKEECEFYRKKMGEIIKTM